MATVVRVLASLLEVLCLEHQAMVATRVQTVHLIRVVHQGHAIIVVLLATMLEIAPSGGLFIRHLSQLSLLGQFSHRPEAVYRVEGVPAVVLSMVG